MTTPSLVVSARMNAFEVFWEGQWGDPLEIPGTYTSFGGTSGYGAVLT